MALTAERHLPARSAGRSDPLRLANGLGWFSIGLGAAQVATPAAVNRLIGRRDHDGNDALMRFYGLREIAAGVGILAWPMPAAGVEARVAGDLIDLASLGLMIGRADVDRRRTVAAAAAVLGITALDVFCLRQLSKVPETDRRRRMVKTIVVNRSPKAVYDFWRRLENFSSLVDGLEVSQPPGERLSRWRLSAPGGQDVRWDAVVVDDDPPHTISWRSTAGADIRNNGSVTFERATGGRGTMVTVEMEYQAPGGKAGTAIAKLFGTEPGQMIETALRRMKQVLETGAVMRSDAGIHSGMHPAHPPGGAKRRDSSIRFS